MNKRRRYKAKARRRMRHLAARFGASQNPLEMIGAFISAFGADGKWARVGRSRGWDMGLGESYVGCWTKAGAIQAVRDARGMMDLETTK